MDALVVFLVVGETGAGDTFGHKGFQFGKMRLVDVAGHHPVAAAEGGRHADNFTHHTGGAHDPDCPEGHVGAAYVTSGHEEIADIAGIEAAVGDGVGMDEDVAVGGDEGAVGKLAAVFRVREVEVDAPGGGE